MIFVTVGTHEQQFNRLIEAVDMLKGKGVIEDEVFIQTGFSTYEPQYCKWSKLISYDEMQNNIRDARIVITHGGPASFIAPLQIGKIPVVVPRQKRFDEHVNDHQVEFCGAVSGRMGNIIMVDDVGELEHILKDYDILCSNLNGGINSNNAFFNEKIEEMVKELL